MQLGWAMHSIKLSELYEAARTGTLRRGPYVQGPKLTSTIQPARPPEGFQTIRSRSSFQTHLRELETSHSTGSCDSFTKAVSRLDMRRKLHLVVKFVFHHKMFKRLGWLYQNWCHLWMRQRERQVALHVDHGSHLLQLRQPQVALQSQCCGRRSALVNYKHMEFR